jgi:hypothetical protein
LERAGLVIFLSDGAKGLREIQQTHFHDARFVLDWFHLRREVYRALQMAVPELDPDYIHAKYVLFKDLLWVGEVDLVLERLDRLRGMLPEPRPVMPSPASKAISKITARALAMPICSSRASTSAPARLKKRLTPPLRVARDDLASPNC